MAFENKIGHVVPGITLEGISPAELVHSDVHDALSPVASDSTENCIMGYDGTDISSPTDGQHLTTPMEDPRDANGDNHRVLLKSLPNVLAAGRPNMARRSSETSLRNLFTNSIISPTKWYKSGKKKRRKSRSMDTGVYSIEYSVFRPIGHLHSIKTESDFQKHLVCILRQEGFDESHGSEPDNYIGADEFEKLVAAITHDVEFDSDLKPTRISQGSSGSYFIVGKHSNPEEITTTIFKRGIFKPKDEEPYGPLSPKWSKWMHRTFFPCFFGRSCLIPNLGYISEAAACVLDRQLLSYIVPYTDIVYLKSPQFYYSFLERTRKKSLRYKIGSFQLFLNGYVEAVTFFKMYPIPQDIERLQKSKPQLLHEDIALEDAHLEFEWTKDVLSQFQEQLEKLVILDYIMRNTDRGADNWMIKLEWKELSKNGKLRRMYPHLKIGAIDSGLAFPWKHPDEWRSFPFGWLFLPYSIIGQPFSNKTRQHYLPLLTSKYWWEQCIVKLKEVFSKDADFKERMWLKQVAVLKGQAFNVVEILKLNYAGPLELTRRENLLIWDDARNVPVLGNSTIMNNAMESSIYDLNSPSWQGRESENVDTETTPLLNSVTSDRRNPSVASLQSGLSGCEPLQMSGFDYNVTYEDEVRHDGDFEEETNTKKVVIERLEKVSSKSPVFTWC